MESGHDMLKATFCRFSRFSIWKGCFLWTSGGWSLAWPNKQIGLLLLHFHLEVVSSSCTWLFKFSNCSSTLTLPEDILYIWVRWKRPRLTESLSHSLQAVSLSVKVGLAIFRPYRCVHWPCRTLLGRGKGQQLLIQAIFKTKTFWSLVIQLNYSVMTRRHLKSIKGDTLYLGWDKAIA